MGRKRKRNTTMVVVRDFRDEREKIKPFSPWEKRGNKKRRDSTTSRQVSLLCSNELTDFHIEVRPTGKGSEPSYERFVQGPVSSTTGNQSLPGSSYEMEKPITEQSVSGNSGDYKKPLIEDPSASSYTSPVKPVQGNEHKRLPEPEGLINTVSSRKSPVAQSSSTHQRMLRRSIPYEYPRRSFQSHGKAPLSAPSTPYPDVLHSGSGVKKKEVKWLTPQPFRPGRPTSGEHESRQRHHGSLPSVVRHGSRPSEEEHRHEAIAEQYRSGRLEERYRMPLLEQDRGRSLIEQHRGGPVPDRRRGGPIPEQDRCGLIPGHRGGPVPEHHGGGPILEQHGSGPIFGQDRRGPMPEQHRGDTVLDQRSGRPTLEQDRHGSRPEQHRGNPILDQRSGGPILEQDTRGLNRGGPLPEHHGGGPILEQHGSRRIFEQDRRGTIPEQHRGDPILDQHSGHPILEQDRRGPRPEQHRGNPVLDQHSGGSILEQDRRGLVPERHRGGPVPEHHGGGHILEQHGSGPIFGQNKREPIPEQHRGNPVLDQHSGGPILEQDRRGPRPEQHRGDPVLDQHSGGPILEQDRRGPRPEQHRGGDFLEHHKGGPSPEQRKSGPFPELNKGVFSPKLGKGAYLQELLGGGPFRERRRSGPSPEQCRAGPPTEQRGVGPSDRPLPQDQPFLKPLHRILEQQRGTSGPAPEQYKTGPFPQHREGPLPEHRSGPSPKNATLGGWQALVTPQMQYGRVQKQDQHGNWPFSEHRGNEPSQRQHRNEASEGLRPSPRHYERDPVAAQQVKEPSQVRSRSRSPVTRYSRPSLGQAGPGCPVAPHKIASSKSEGGSYSGPFGTDSSLEQCGSGPFVGHCRSEPSSLSLGTCRSNISANQYGLGPSTGQVRNVPLTGGRSMGKSVERCRPEVSVRGRGFFARQNVTGSPARRFGSGLIAEWLANGSANTRDVPKNDVTSPLIIGPDASLGSSVALDCEMVGAGKKGCISMLGCIAVVNHHGHILLHTMVAPAMPVTDYRTPFSGIRKRDLVGAPSFESVQNKVVDLLGGRILVGHDIHQDLKVLKVVHPEEAIRDTSNFYFCPFERIQGWTRSKLRTMFEKQTGFQIQTGEHCPIEDARAAMVLYQRNQEAWEASLSKKAP